ncbi:MAG: dihydropteroate synthase [Solirubrobacterales bacterium]
MPIDAPVSARSTSWSLAGRVLDLSAPIGAGIVNVTEDSFFSGARSGTPERAVEDGLALVEAGFEMLDVGAVAARSGPPVSPEEEAAKLIPALAALAERSGVPVSADTFSPLVAIRADAAGAEVINDIGGGHPEMLEAVAETGCGYVLMHIEGPPRVDREPPGYDDPVDHLKAWFAERIEAALAAGIDERRIAIDPGFDFDLSLADGLEIMRRLGELHSLGRPLFLSLSRKDFLGAVLAGSWEKRLPAEEREWATCAAAAIATAAGAQVLRLHDASALDAVRVAARIVHG